MSVLIEERCTIWEKLNVYSTRSLYKQQRVNFIADNFFCLLEYGEFLNFSVKSM